MSLEWLSSSYPTVQNPGSVNFPIYFKIKGSTLAPRRINSKQKVIYALGF
jgi:hypothetical protein